MLCCVDMRSVDMLLYIVLCCVDTLRSSDIKDLRPCSVDVCCVAAVFFLLASHEQPALAQFFLQFSTRSVGFGGCMK